MIVHQLYFDENSKSNCFSESIKHKLPSIKSKEDIVINPFLENTGIVDVIKKYEDNDHIGVLSHAFRHKIGYDYKSLQDINAESEVISFFRHCKASNYIQLMEMWHKDSKRCLELILDRIGQYMPTKVLDPIYQNAFFATGEVYRDYVDAWLEPAMLAMSNKDDKELWGYCWLDSNYSKLKKMDFDYPLHPFVLERLFSLYCTNKNIKVQNLKPKNI